MKTKVFLLGILATCLSIVPASAYGLGDIRVNARFMTDRMAFELHLNTNQYNDLYEINYDFFNSINPYIAEIAIANVDAMNAYYRYLDIRNDDLRWVLTSTEYARFITLEYFFRPLYTMNNVCYLHIYKIYPNRTFFYYKPPRHYLTYRGGHCRVHFRGKSYYRQIFPKKYHHPVYPQACHAHPQGAYPKPGHANAAPHKNPGYRFSPVDHRPTGTGPHTSVPHKPVRPENGKPGMSKPDRNQHIRPHAPAVKPYHGKPGITKPGKPASPNPSAQKRPNVRKSQPSGKHSIRQGQSSRQASRPEARQL